MTKKETKSKTRTDLAQMTIRELNKAWKDTVVAMKNSTNRHKFDELNEIAHALSYKLWQWPGILALYFGRVAIDFPA